MASQQLQNDPRILAARQLLAESKAADTTQVEAARWWGRLEQTLASVLDAIGEVPPF